ncbi:hypothetical protein P692DRAFT_20842223 [Suillus brevipes Sb2]|nr:hypothetical protein P692DRAFT_20842223 [Suillus brevipes Sb2]
MDETPLECLIVFNPSCPIPKIRHWHCEFDCVASSPCCGTWMRLCFGSNASIICKVDGQAVCKVVETTLNCVEPRWDCPIRLNFHVDALDSNVGPILRKLR